jgi:hypothetical protein
LESARKNLVLVEVVVSESASDKPEVPSPDGPERMKNL